VQSFAKELRHRHTECGDLYDVGVYAHLVRIIEMPTSDTVTAIFQSQSKCKLEKVTALKPFTRHCVAFGGCHADKKDREFKTLAEDFAPPPRN
jgi:ATP-dependent Lon protease